LERADTVAVKLRLRVVTLTPQMDAFGARVDSAEGFVVGTLTPVGFLVVEIFAAVGLLVGILVGVIVFTLEGARDGTRKGDDEGRFVGFLDGVRNGDALGNLEGLNVGVLLLGDKVVFFTGLTVGEATIGAS